MKLAVFFGIFVFSALFVLFAHAAEEIGDPTSVAFVILSGLCLVGVIGCFIGTTINLTTP